MSRLLAINLLMTKATQLLRFALTVSSRQPRRNVFALTVGSRNVFARSLLELATSFLGARRLRQEKLLTFRKLFAGSHSFFPNPPLAIVVLPFAKAFLMEQWVVLLD